MRKWHDIIVLCFVITASTLSLGSCSGGGGGSAPPLSSAKAITGFSIVSSGATGTIDEGAKTISVTVPFGTNKTALVASFTTTGASVKVGSTVQVSGITQNDFSSPVVYRVTAADSTTTDYAVTVTVALNPAKAITAFSFVYQAATGTIDEVAKTISVGVPSGTNVTALVTTFTITGASVQVGTTDQVSGTTQNDFTNPVEYVVNAADSTTATYTVTVTKSPPMIPDTGQTGDYTTTLGEDSDYTINPPSYLDNGDGTIFDKVPGLMWQKCTVGKGGADCSTGAAAAYNWYEASGTTETTYNPSGATDVCGNMTLAGYTDWRLPMDFELMLIRDFGTSNPAINTTYFPGTSSYYWSVTTYAGDAALAWRVGFNDYEGVNSISKITGTGIFVRCVR